MGSVYEEFKRELDRLRTQCAENPRREMIRLFLLALEREEIVSIGYRGSLMDRRLASMPIPDDVKKLILHALLWIWKDEEMHTIYIRGAILKIGGFRLRMQAFLAQAAGGVGGWASSVMQHSKFMRAGRLAHRSPWIRNFYLTGSSTHPGQWVSFCAVSGILTANQLLQDLER